MNEIVCPFSVLIYLFLFITILMLKFFSETKFRVGHSPLLISVSQEAAECYYITIHMNAFFRENVSLILAESSSNAFFAHLTPSGTAIIQAHSTPRGTEQKGTE